MPRNKLAKLLLGDEKAAPESSITKFGLENITNLSHFLKQRVNNLGVNDYDPLYEIAKIAILTDKDDLRFRCHQELAKYVYPQIRSLEIQAKEDKEINIKVSLAGYASSKDIREEESTADDEVEDIETEGDLVPEEDKKFDYQDFVLKQASEKGKDIT